jgi:small-conductance mechanosensitive channel
MQAHDGPPHDLSAQMAKVKAKTRPWKEAIALVLAIAAAATSGWAHGHFQHFFSSDQVVNQIIAAATAAAFCVFASVATLGLSGKAQELLKPLAGESHSSIVRYTLVLLGAVTTLVVTLVLFGVPIGQLLVGAGLASVFVGIAAQQALSNLFAGLILLLAHPFSVGDSVRLRAGAMSGEIGGTVREIGITYVRLATPDGMLSVPNSLVLGSIVGPLQPGVRLPSPAQPVPSGAAPAALGAPAPPAASSPPGTVSPPVTASPAATPAPPAPGAADGSAGTAGER